MVEPWNGEAKNKTVGLLLKKAKYIALVSTIQEAIWMRQLTSPLENHPHETMPIQSLRLPLVWPKHPNFLVNQNISIITSQIKVIRHLWFWDTVLHVTLRDFQRNNLQSWDLWQELFHQMGTLARTLLIILLYNVILAHVCKCFHYLLYEADILTRNFQ